MNTHSNDEAPRHIEHSPRTYSTMVVRSYPNGSAGEYVEYNVSIPVIPRAAPYPLDQSSSSALTGALEEVEPTNPQQVSFKGEQQIHTAQVLQPVQGRSENSQTTDSESTTQSDKSDSQDLELGRVRATSDVVVEERKRDKLRRLLSRAVKKISSVGRMSRSS